MSNRRHITDDVLCAEAIWTVYFGLQCLHKFHTSAAELQYSAVFSVSLSGNRNL